ncbi:MAG: ATP-binding cassette domain-containing protein [Fibrobacter sp.]|nr:ATP-binding cassette domain-containing protein [Fibrobacter sp.]
MANVEIDDLRFTYLDGTMALDGISLNIADGESVGIVGANGAGKSTLVNHLNGYYLPQNGTIKIAGEVLSKKTQENIRRIVGVVFQNPDDQLFSARLYDDVAFGPENLGVEISELQKRVETTMKELNLWELRDKSPAHISHGQKRFAAFATVLVMKPDVIVMDEPTSDLDPRNRRKLINLVNALSATRITVSHDLDFIFETCKLVALMSTGKIVAYGKTEEILSNQLLLESNGLELPLKLQK